MKKTDLAFTRVELLFCLLGAVLVGIPAVSLYSDGSVAFTSSSEFQSAITRFGESGSQHLLKPK